MGWGTINRRAGRGNRTLNQALKIAMSFYDGEQSEED
jgi:hypothetical protein